MSNYVAAQYGEGDLPRLIRDSFRPSNCRYKKRLLGFLLGVVLAFFEPSNQCCTIK